MPRGIFPRWPFLLPIERLDTLRRMFDLRRRGLAADLIYRELRRLGDYLPRRTVRSIVPQIDWALQKSRTMALGPRGARINVREIPVVPQEFKKRFRARFRLEAVDPRTGERLTREWIEDRDRLTTRAALERAALRNARRHFRAPQSREDTELVITSARLVSISRAVIIEEYYE